jgi:ribose/xylose/arabinose/galactoside ABC-type transport system permease subunit
MNDYSIALFLHIVGALGFFVALGLEWTGLSQIRSAMTLEQVRAWMGILKNLRKVGFASMAATVITGIYLMLTAWGGVPWIIVTLGSLVLLIALAHVLTAPRMAGIGKALVTEKGPFSKTFHSLANNPLLSISIQTRITIALGIVFLKIVKPDWGGSLLTIGIAIALGLALALPVARRERAQEGSAD